MEENLTLPNLNNDDHHIHPPSVFTRLKPTTWNNPTIQALIKNLIVADRAHNSAAGGGIAGACGMLPEMAMTMVKKGPGITRPISPFEDVYYYVRLPHLFDTALSASDMTEMDVEEPLLPERLFDGSTPTTDKVDDVRGAVPSQGCNLLSGSHVLEIHLVARRVGVDGYSLISLNTPFMFTRECKPLILRAKDLNWEGVQPRCCKSVMSRNKVFLLGGAGPRSPHITSPRGIEDVYFMDIKGAARSRRWNRGPSMSAKRLNHAAVSVDENIYVFGGHQVYTYTEITGPEGTKWKVKYTPCAEVYDTNEEKWSKFELPYEVAKHCKRNDHCCVTTQCCVVNIGGKKKILVFCEFEVFAYDLNSKEWEKEYLIESQCHSFNNSFANPFYLLKVVPSGSMLFFITVNGWWVFDLESMNLLDNTVSGIFEMVDELPPPGVKCGDHYWPNDVIGLGCSGGIHDFVVFYRASDDDDDDPSYIYAVRIAVAEDSTKNFCVAVLRSFALFRLEDLEVEHFYAAVPKFLVLE